MNYFQACNYNILLTWWFSCFIICILTSASRSLTSTLFFQPIVYHLFTSTIYRPLCYIYLSIVYLHKLPVLAFNCISTGAKCIVNWSASDCRSPSLAINFNVPWLPLPMEIAWTRNKNVVVLIHYFEYHSFLKWKFVWIYGHFMINFKKNTDF